MKVDVGRTQVVSDGQLCDCGDLKTTCCGHHISHVRAQKVAGMNFINKDVTFAISLLEL